MPRKSLANERREQLLNAFERCIVKYGLEATSLEQVADEAGMTRSIIRHYIGNRDDLVGALVERRLRESAQLLEAKYTGLSPTDSVQLTLDTMFAAAPSIDERDRVILEIIFTTKGHYPRAKAMLRQAFEDLVRSFATDLRHAYPQATYKRCMQVSYAIICMSEMNEAFMWLGMPQRYNAHAREIAESLLKTLGRPD